MPTIQDQIRAAFAEARDAAGVSEYAIAKRLGIAQSTLSRWVTRENDMNSELLARLCELLGIVVTVKVNRSEAKRNLAA
ncbi:MAG: helix-turn-helix domain-containing protein [Phycisphaerales bacterium JB050]